jgi:hypothetical protein
VPYRAWPVNSTGLIALRAHPIRSPSESPQCMTRGNCTY